MVLRGSNDAKPHLLGRKWMSISTDNGHHWSTPRPWTYADGQSFFSPSSCSQLLTHSNGRIYWIGNICPSNPRGNLPRYPLVIGEVDPASGGLICSTVNEIDSRRDGDWERMQVSNFFAREDRETGDIMIHCAPFDRTRETGTDGKPGEMNWTSDAWLYRVKIAVK